MSSRKITFVGANGAELAARLDLPAGAARAYAIFAHCFTCSKDAKAATFLSATLVEQGIAMLRFDFTGLGGSGGDFANTNFSSNVADLVAAADYVHANHGLPEILIGHSLGGAAVLAAASKIAEARAIATINAPFDPAHVLRMMASARPEIETAGEAEVTLGGRRFRVGKQFIEDIGQHPVTEGLKRMQKALLVMHAPLDATVGIDNASNIFLAARHPKSFLSLDGADHMLSRREDATYAGSVLAAWAARYIAHRPWNGADTSREAPGATMVAAGEDRGGEARADNQFAPPPLHASEPITR
jgi:alpha/beta superfamily hydrolase